MTTCAKGRKKTEALEVFKSRQEIRPDFDVISYNSLIIAYANRGKIEPKTSNAVLINITLLKPENITFEFTERF